VVISLQRGADCFRMVQLMPLHPETPSSLATLKYRLVLPFWYQLTQVVLEKRLLNRCSSSSTVSVCQTLLRSTLACFRRLVRIGIPHTRSKTLLLCFLSGNASLHLFVVFS